MMQATVIFYMHFIKEKFSAALLERMTSISYSGNAEKVCRCLYNREIAGSQKLKLFGTSKILVASTNTSKERS